MANTDPTKKYVLSETKKNELDALIKKENIRQSTLPTTQASTGMPPARLGKITTSWEPGDETLEIETVSFVDNATVIGTTPFDIYITWFNPKPRDDEYLQAGSIVPYIPFNGPDTDNVYGIMAGELQEDSYKSFAEYYYLSGGNLTFSLNDGIVYLGAEGSGTTVTASAYDINTTGTLYIEITAGADSSIIVDPNVQLTFGNLASLDVYELDVPGKELTLRIPLGEIVADATLGYNIYKRYHDGDINMIKPYMPDVNADVQGPQFNDVVLAAVKTLMGISDSTADGALETLMELREQTPRIEQGGIERLEDGTDTKKIEGWSETLNSSEFEVDDGAEDELGFLSTVYEDIYKFGIRQNGVTESSSTNKYFVFDEWLGLKNLSFYHKQSPLVSQSDSTHTGAIVRIDLVNSKIYIDGVEKSPADVEFYFDNNGHLALIDEDTLTPLPTRYLYVPCDGSGTPSIVVSSDLGQVVDFDSDPGTCYDQVGEVELALTDPAPTVINTYTDCSTCTGSADKTQWKKCSDDSDAVIYASGAGPDSDYAWIEIASAWVEAYNSSTTTATPTSPVPCFVDPSSTEVPVAQRVTPASCIDVKYDAFGDDFSGSSINSCKWDSSEAGNVQTGGNLVQTPYSSDQVISLLNTNLSLSSFAFIKGKFSTSGFNQGASPGKDPLVGLYVSGSSGICSIYISYTYSAASRDIWPRIDGTFGTKVSTTATAGYFRQRLISGTYYVDFSTDGSSWTNYMSAASTTTIDTINLITKDDNATQTLVTSWDCVEIQE